MFSLPLNDAQTQIKDTDVDCLKKCYQSVLSGKQINLELEVIGIILLKNFKIKLNTLKTDLANVLPYVLVYHINNWPGWKISPKQYPSYWYKEFTEFLARKLKDTIDKHYTEIVAQINLDQVTQNYKDKKIVDMDSQCDGLIKSQAYAPFSINLTGPPALLNTLVFTETNEGNIILKGHNPVEWPGLGRLSIKQILSWPHVGVQLFSPILHFSRRNVHTFNRFVSFVPTPMPFDVQDSEQNCKLIHGKKKFCYTVDYLQWLTSNFLKVLHDVIKVKIDLEVIEVLFQEVLADIEELGILRNGKPTIASNACVSFNIGKCTYFRNKKLMKTQQRTQQEIGYTEIIVPKIETLIHEVASENLVTSYLEELNNHNENIGPHRVTYSCLFCKVTFEVVDQLVAHFIDEHKMEPDMKCVVCKKICSILELTSERWRHECGGTAQVKTVRKQ